MTSQYQNSFPKDAILRVDNLKMHFPVHAGLMARQVSTVKAVDDISLYVRKGETLGVVGESGCGKSTLAKCLVRLNTPTSGKMEFQDTDITHLSNSALRPLRRDFQMMFQDPAESLNSRMSVGEIVAEPLLIHGLYTPESRAEQVIELLQKVGLPNAKEAVNRFPAEFSGGQRQRIGIARALALNPNLIILDEPVSALDVSVQSQVLNLLVDLQKELDLAYLFIAHDLAVVKHISDRIAVMYLGKIVEIGDADDIYLRPKHAYTKALLSAIPVPDPTVKKKRVRLEGDVPSPINPPEGSHFGHRMNHPKYEETIGLEMPLFEVAPGHWVAADPCCLTESDYQLVKENGLK